MADKPSRSLVLYGEASARFVTPAETHLHNFARRAICGLLSLKHLPPSENEDANVIGELAELLDANESLGNSVDEPIDKLEEDRPFPSVAERFMVMKAAIVSDNSAVRSLGVRLGFKVMDWHEIHDESKHSSPLARGLLRLLGLEEGKALDANAFDLVLAHVGSGKITNDHSNIKPFDHLVGELFSIVESEPEIGSRLHLSVVLSYGPTLDNDHVDFSFLDNHDELQLLIPCRQSYVMKAGKIRENVRKYCPMLLAQYQKAVTRKDTVESFSFRDFIEKAGNLVTPADRFIHEVAFKLWKAPKYGA